jgi:hypothetical protein
MTALTSSSRGTSSPITIAAPAPSMGMKAA